MTASAPRLPQNVEPKDVEPEVDLDHRFMAAALALGRRGLGRTAPNPAVGALVVKDGIVVGRGWTGDGGRPHAETAALAAAGPLAKGATLYVSLEPCNHHGKTPPCSEAIISSGIARVVSALEDPDPRVAGEGHRRLLGAGIPVTCGVLAEAATRGNLGHILRVTAGRPMVTLKLAETADGFAADQAGAPRLAITGAAANGFVHMLRATHDAVMVGIGTALADDPLLTVRLPGLADRKPLRLVLDADLRLSPQARLIAAREAPVLVVAGEGASAEGAAPLTAEGVEIIFARRAAGGLDLDDVLKQLGARGLTRILCEGGPTLAAALIAQGFADEVIVLTSPDALGHAGVPALTDAARAKLAATSAYDPPEIETAGEDRIARYQRVL